MAAFGEQAAQRSTDSSPNTATWPTSMHLWRPRLATVFSAPDGLQRSRPARRRSAYDPQLGQLGLTMPRSEQRTVIPQLGHDRPKFSVYVWRSGTPGYQGRGNVRTQCGHAPPTVYRNKDERRALAGLSLDGRHWARTSDPQLVDFAHPPPRTHRHRRNRISAHKNRDRLGCGRCQLVSER
jgi:hypothetical protein